MYWIFFFFALSFSFGEAVDCINKEFSLNNSFTPFGCDKLNFSIEILSTETEDLLIFENITIINGSLTINNQHLLTSLSGFQSLTSIGGKLSISNDNSLKNFSGFNSLTNIGSNFYLYGNDELENLSGLESLMTIGGYFQVQNNNKLVTISQLSSLQSVAGTFAVIFHSRFSTNYSSSNTNLQIQSQNFLLFFCKKIVLSYFFLNSVYQNDNLTSISGINNLVNVGQNFEVFNNTKLVSLLIFNSLTKIERGLRFVGGSLFNCSDICNRITIWNLRNVTNTVIQDSCNVTEIPTEVCTSTVISSSTITQFSSSKNTETSNQLTTESTTETNTESNTQKTLISSINTEQNDPKTTDPNVSLISKSDDFTVSDFISSSIGIDCKINDCEIFEENGFTVFTVDTLNVNQNLVILNNQEIRITYGNFTLNGFNLSLTSKSMIKIQDGCLDAKNSTLFLDLDDIAITEEKQTFHLIEYQCIKNEFEKIDVSSSSGVCLAVEEIYSSTQYSVLITEDTYCVNIGIRFNLYSYISTMLIIFVTLF